MHGADGVPHCVRLFPLPSQHGFSRHVGAESYGCLCGVRLADLSVAQSLWTYAMFGYLCHQSVDGIPSRGAAHGVGHVGDDVLHPYQMVLENLIFHSKLIKLKYE